MGGGCFNFTEYSTRSVENKTKSTEQIFSNKTANNEFNPAHISLRESCDGVDNPASRAIIIALDTSGSMSFCATKLAKDGLGDLIKSLLDHKPVTDPQIMINFYDDLAYCSGKIPLLAGQFESDLRILDSLERMSLTGRGGGNARESENGPWLFAARKTKIDCYDKRKEKGYIFTVGDECTPDPITVDQARNYLDIDIQATMSNKDILEEVQEKYHVFHLIVEEGHYCRSFPDKVKDSWKELLGVNAMPLSDHQHLSAVVTSIISINEGADIEATISRWQDEETRKVVRHALYDMRGQHQPA